MYKLNNNMPNYKNKVCLIQSEVIFEDDTRIEFLKIKKRQLLTSNDAYRIFNFIKNHVCKNNIFKFVLHIDSKVLTDLIDYVDNIKQNSPKTRKWLKKCTFIATYSSADYVREKVKSMNAEIYFALSPLSTVLKSTPNGSVLSNSDQKTKILVVVSNNTENEYYNQVYDYYNTEGTTVKKTRLEELETDLLTEFAEAGGYLIIAALDTEGEYDILGEAVKNSNFREQVHIIECTQPTSKGVQDLQSQVSDIQTSSSGVCMNGSGFLGLNTLIPYEKCAAALVLIWRCWGRLKQGKILELPK